MVTIFILIALGAVLLVIWAIVKTNKKQSDVVQPESEIKAESIPDPSGPPPKRKF